MPDELLSKPVGKRIYADTMAEYDTSRYRNSLCAKWLNESGADSVDYLPFTPKPMLTPKSPARQKLEERRGHPTSEPNYEGHVKRKQPLRASEHCERSQRSPVDFFRDVIDAPDEFKCPSKPKKNRAPAPFKPIEPFDDFMNEFMVHTQAPATTGTAKKHRNGKRKREPEPEFALERKHEFSEFFDGDVKRATSTGRIDEYESDHHEQLTFVAAKRRPEATRASDAMALYKPQNHFGLDLEPDFFMNAAHTTHNPHRSAGNIREFRRNQNEQRAVSTDIITMPSRSNRNQHIIFNIKCENLMIANDNEYKKKL